MVEFDTSAERSHVEETRRDSNLRDIPRRMAETLKRNATTSPLGAQ